jgi:hypothetical protein
LLLYKNKKVCYKGNITNENHLRSNENLLSFETEGDKMKIRRARIDGGFSPCAATPENIGKKRCCHIADMASKATLSVLTAIALTACTATNGGSTVPAETNPIQSAGPTETTAESVQTTETTQVAPTNETTEETVYIYGGRYYHQGDPAIEGKSVEAMTLSDAQNAGYTDGATMTADEKCAYDYNMTWDMVAQGKSDAEIREALLNYGYENNEEAANFMIDWVRADYASGQRAYEAPETPSGSGSGSGSSGSGSSGSGSSGSGSSGSGNSGSGSSSGSGNSGSGNSGSSGGSSSGSGNSGSGNSGSGNSGSSGGSTQPTETQAPAPTETQAPAPTEPAPTEPAPTQPAPTETTPPPATPTPVPATPTPAPTISYYELTGTAFDDDGNEHTNTFTGSSKSDVRSQYSTWVSNHGYIAGSYSVVAVYSDGSRKSA